jgi:hypothetical protein
MGGFEMRVVRFRWAASLAAVILLVAACGGGSTASPAGGGGVAPSSGAPAANGDASGAPAANGGSTAGSLNACDLLTADQIKGIVGWPVQAGVLQQTDTQTDCEWAAQASDGGSVGLIVADFDDTLWQAGAAAGSSTAVPGIGDAAYKGWPHAGDLNIKVDGYQISVAIIDFTAAADKVDAEDLALAKLVLPKL